MAMQCKWNDVTVLVCKTDLKNQKYLTSLSILFCSSIVFLNPLEAKTLRYQILIKPFLFVPLKDN